MPVVETPAADQSERARQTLARIRAALDAGKSAGIAQIVELIREVTCKFETISVQALGEVIGRDLLTMSRVISVAHTLGFNPEGVEISTISQAIHVIGFNKIRNLALSLMLMQNASSSAATEKRNVAALALVSGLIAQGVRSRQDPQDAEEAFVCAALRNYGRIMLANFLPEEYRAALSQANHRGEGPAFREQFGYTPLELTHALFEHSRMPRNILHGLREVPPATKSAPLSQEMELPVVADFAEALSRLIARTRDDRDAFKQQAAQLVSSYGSNIGMSADDLLEILLEVGGTLNMFGALTPGNSLNCPLLSNLSLLAGIRSQVSAPAEAIKPTEASDVSPAVDGKKPSTTKTQSPVEPVVPAGRKREPLALAIAELQVLRAKAAEATAAHQVVLDALQEALEFSHVLVFRRASQPGCYETWLGKGDLFQMWRGETLLDANERNVFSVCLRRGEDVIIQNPADPKILPFIPEWLQPSAGSQPLVLLPIRDARGTSAVYCGLRARPGGYLLGPRLAQQLHQLRQLLREFESPPGVIAGTADVAGGR